MLRKIQHWIYFVSIALVVVFVSILPIDAPFRTIGGPDFMLTIAITWSLKRPDLLPVFLIGVTFLFLDLMLHRPPGLFSMVVVAASLFAAYRHPDFREAVFAAEWLFAAALILGVFLVYRVLIFFTLLSAPVLTVYLSQAVFSVLLYPVIVFLGRNIWNAPSEFSAEEQPKGKR